MVPTPSGSDISSNTHSKRVPLAAGRQRFCSAGTGGRATRGAFSAIVAVTRETASMFHSFQRTVPLFEIGVDRTGVPANLANPGAQNSGSAQGANCRIWERNKPGKKPGLRVR
jgi:hypothetical protein